MNTRPPIDDAFLPAESPEPGATAREQFAHGVLESYTLDTAKHRERRVAAMIAAVQRESSGLTFFWRRARVLTGLAAAIVIVAVVMLATPSQPSAMAMVQASLAASERAGDRRYEVRARLPHESEIEAEPMATIDVRDAQHVLARIRTPHGDRITLGRNGDESWAILPDGEIDRFPPKRAWPRWVDFGQSTVLLVPVEDLMTTLEKSYTLRKLPVGASPSGKGPVCDRVVADRKIHPSPEPARIELWIDQQSKLVRRMELSWPPPRPRDVDGRRPPPPPRDRPPREPGMELRDPPPHELDRPERRPRREMDGPREPRPGEPRPGEPGFRPPPRPPELGPPHRPHRPRPEFLGEPPDFERGPRPPPPRILVFELVDGAEFGAQWFEATTHMATEKP